MTSAKESQLAVPGIGFSFPLAKRHRVPRLKVSEAGFPVGCVEMASGNCLFQV